MVKKLSGGDTITVNVKYGQRISFINRCKLIFAANVLPAIRYDNTNAIWRRVHKILCSREFYGKKDDPGLKSKLTSPKELTGLLNLVLGYYQELMKRKRFIKEKSIIQSQEDYILTSNSIHAYAKWGIEYEENNEISNPEFFDGFLGFCREHKIVPTSQRILTEKFQIYFPKAYRTRTKKERKWKHIAFRNSFKLPKKNNPKNNFRGDTGDAFPFYVCPQSLKYAEGTTVWGKYVKNKQEEEKCQKRHQPKEQEKTLKIDLLLEIIDTLMEKDEDGNVGIMTIVNEAVSKGMNKREVVKSIEKFTMRGMFFEPEEGVLRKP